MQLSLFRPTLLPGWWEVGRNSIGVGIGEGGGTGGMCPPKFHKLLYKLLTTLCVVSDCVCPPNQKVFPMPLNRGFEQGNYLIPFYRGNLFRKS